MPHSTQLSLSKVTVTFDHRVVLDSVSCAVTPGGVTGLIGENGSGKTTLLRLLAGRLQPDAGMVVTAAGGGLGYAAQDIVWPLSWTVAQAVDDSLAELREMADRLRSLLFRLDEPAALAEYGELQSVFEVREGYAADARAAAAMAGLGLARLDPQRRLAQLSGGEQVRLQLAGVLAAGPEVLLLDEPTNHLDVAAVEWLEQHLRGRSGTTVLVSHDREFLNRVCGDLLEIDGDTHAVTRYGGGYDDFLRAKAVERARALQARADWESAVEAQRTSADTTARRVAPGRGPKDNEKMAYDYKGGRVQESLASRVRNAQERLRRLLADPAPAPAEPLRFQAGVAGPREPGSPLRATSVGYAGRLAPVSLQLRAGQRLLVAGPNGAGKSTLLSLLAGTLAPTAGTVSRPVRIGYLPQESVFPEPDRTLVETFAAGRPGTAEQLRQRLTSLGLFRDEQLDVRVGNLSTGQRRRLALARLLTMRVDLLLLDEPTNHLSLTLVEEVEAALASYSGMLVVVSHDRLLRRRWTGRVLDLVATS